MDLQGNSKQLIIEGGKSTSSQREFEDRPSLSSGDRSFQEPHVHLKVEGKEKADLMEQSGEKTGNSTLEEKFYCRLQSLKDDPTNLNLWSSVYNEALYFDFLKKNFQKVSEKIVRKFIDELKIEQFIVNYHEPKVSELSRLQDDVKNHDMDQKKMESITELEMDPKKRNRALKREINKFKSNFLTNDFWKILMSDFLSYKASVEEDWLKTQLSIKSEDIAEENFRKIMKSVIESDKNLGDTLTARLRSGVQIYRTPDDDLAEKTYFSDTESDDSTEIGNNSSYEMLSIPENFPAEEEEISGESDYSFLSL